MAMENLIYPRPTEKFIYEKRAPVDVVCPVCGGKNVKRYRVIMYLGPKIRTKCQDCLHILQTEEPTVADQWPPYWAITRSGRWKPSRAG